MAPYIISGQYDAGQLSPHSRPRRIVGYGLNPAMGMNRPHWVKILSHGERIDSFLFGSFVRHVISFLIVDTANWQFFRYIADKVFDAFTA